MFQMGNLTTTVTILKNCVIINNEEKDEKLFIDQTECVTNSVGKAISC